MKTTPKRTAADKRRRASQRDILGGSLSSIANALQASLTALQTHAALDQATLTAQERRQLAKLTANLTLIERFLRSMAKRLSKNRDTREQQAKWSDNGKG